MPTTFCNGDIFNSGADVLVNPVNCVGVMGKGLAAEFKKRFPRDFVVYEERCRSGDITIGRGMDTVESGQIIHHFPTKKHWRDPSKMVYISRGLANLLSRLEFHTEHNREHQSVAIPALGCGLGGLPWGEVMKRIDEFMGDWPGNVLVIIPSKQVCDICYFSVRKFFWTLNHTCDSMWGGGDRRLPWLIRSYAG